MYKKYSNGGGGLSDSSYAHISVPPTRYLSSRLKSLLMRVKLTCIFLSVAFLQISLASKAQQITLPKNNISLAELSKEMNQHRDSEFVYKQDLLKKGTRINVHAQDKPLREVLDARFKNQPFTYEIESDTVIVSPRRET